MKICQVGTELFHADGCTDGQTDMTKLIVAFHNFVNASKNTPCTCGCHTKLYIKNLAQSLILLWCFSIRNEICIVESIPCLYRFCFCVIYYISSLHIHDVWKLVSIWQHCVVPWCALRWNLPSWNFNQCVIFMENIIKDECPQTPLCNYLISTEVKISLNEISAYSFLT